LRVFENRVLRSLFEPKRDEGTGEWRKLHDEELNLYCSQNIVWVIKIEKNRMGGACSTYGGVRRCIVCFRGNTCENEALGRPRPRWENNIKMDLQEVGWLAWTGLI